MAESAESVALGCERPTAVKRVFTTDARRYGATRAHGGGGGRGHVRFSGCRHPWRFFLCVSVPPW